MRKHLILVAAMAMMATLLQVSAATAAPPAPVETSPIAIPLDDTGGLTEIDAPIRLTGDSRVVVTQERGKKSDSRFSPYASVGLGWYVYVYLSRSDYQWLQTLSGAVAMYYVCLWVTAAGVIPGVACAIAAAIVYYYLTAGWTPPSGYCREFKFTYGGGYAGTKLVRRSC